VERVYLFNGHDIERWMLKTLIGTVASRNARANSGNRILDWQPSKLWLDILLGRKSFPRKWGMYFKGRVGETRVRPTGLTVAALGGEGKSVYGGIFSINGYDFVFAMDEPPTDKTGTILQDSTFRPYELAMLYEGATKSILITWDVKGQNQKIAIQLNQIIPPS
jgi:hypothetical protein